MLTNVLFNISACELTSEIVTYIWQVPLLGMGMVFAVLGILWAVLTIFKLMFVGATPKTQVPKSKAEPEKAEVKTEAVADAELMAVLTAAVAAHQNNDEIIAVLTAAVSAYRAEAGEVSGFRVVAFKRAQGRAWNRK